MAGGIGKRIQSVDSSVPKPLIKIDGKPILQWEIECLVSQGYTDIILTVSHMAEKIQSFFADGSEFNCNIRYYVEEQPLGNAGALFKMLKLGMLTPNEHFLLLNADSMFDIDFDRFVKKHIESCASATLFVHPSNHIYDSGLIISDENGWVERWLNKEDERPQWYRNCANAGLHVISSSVLCELVENGVIDPDAVGTEGIDGKIIKVDLDREILKPLAADVSGKKQMLAVSSPEYVKDMGTPERFKQVVSDLSSGLVHKRNLSFPQKAIFLDRDGTINQYVGFLRNIDDFHLLPGVAEAIKLINKSGYLVVVVTNQPVIARGEVTESELQLIHNKMETELGTEGAYLDAIYYCPHHPDKGFEGEIERLKIECDCRKPKPGMFFRAAEDFNIDLCSSWMIGDSENDILAGKNANCKTALLLYPNDNPVKSSFGQDITACSLIEAVKMIIH